MTFSWASAVVGFLLGVMVSIGALILWRQWVRSRIPAPDTLLVVTTPDSLVHGLWITDADGHSHWVAEHTPLVIVGCAPMNMVMLHIRTSSFDERATRFDGLLFCRSAELVRWTRPLGSAADLAARRDVYRERGDG